jgi:mono/diheme cytochrome c family protein
MRTLTAMALGAMLLSSCAPPPQIDDKEAAQAEITAARGEAIYGVVCWACHGLGGHGDGPAADSLDGYRPPTFHTPDFATATPRRLEQLFALAQADDPEHPHALYVTPFLTDEGLTEALTYVSVLTAPAHVPGSARNGALLFERLCAGCHGADGRNGGNVRAFILDQDPIDLHREPPLGERPWDDLFDILDVGEDRFHGTRAPAWGQVLDDAEVWDLVAHIAVLRAPSP